MDDAKLGTYAIYPPIYPLGGIRTLIIDSVLLEGQNLCGLTIDR